MPTFDIYRNLNAKDPSETWSVIDRTAGRVVTRASHLNLTGVAFIVQPAGAARTFATQVKSPHAFVRVVAPTWGHAIADGEAYEPDEVTHRITYRPKRGWDSFRYVEGPRKGQPITFSEYINLSADGSAHAL
tara:strand:- start:1065 stop:1460 length:396 start_codon:yes stop_codon:yes gene_type:complete